MRKTENLQYRLDLFQIDPARCAEIYLAALKARNALCFHYGICYKSNGSLKNTVAKPYEKPSKEEIMEALNNARAYPNPSNQFVTIEFKLFHSEEDTKIDIFNSEGRLMQSKALGKHYEGQQLFDTRDWPTGLYFYHILQNGDKVISSKFMVVH